MRCQCACGQCQSPVASGLRRHDGAALARSLLAASAAPYRRAVISVFRSVLGSRLVSTPPRNSREQSTHTTTYAYVYNTPRVSLLPTAAHICAPHIHILHTHTCLTRRFLGSSARGGRAFAPRPTFFVRRGERESAQAIAIGSGRAACGARPPPISGRRQWLALASLTPTPTPQPLRGAPRRARFPSHPLDHI